MNTIKFSIVIPTYNRARLLERCLKSIISQTYTNWEAIIVDNYSEDNSEEIVKSYKDNRIIYVKNHNYGVISVSRNKALDLATGDWICFLDSDDSWFPEKLEVIYQHTTDNDIVYHQYVMNIEKKRPFQRIKSDFYDANQMTIQEVLMRGDPINPSCTAVKREVIGELRFSEDKSLFAVEDYDFFLQLIEKKPKIKRLDNVLTHYDVATGVSHGRVALDRDRKLYQKYFNRLNKNERREVIKYYYLRKASYFYSPGLYPIAMKYFAIASTSKNWIVKKQGFAGWAKALVLNLLSRK